MPGFRQRSTNAQPVWLADDDGNILTEGLPYEDQQVFAARGYTVSTAIVAVASGSYLSYELVNPAGSGVNFIMTARVFSNNIVGGNPPAEYVRYQPSATLPTGGTAVSVNNRISGGAAAPSGTTFTYVMGTSAPTGGAATSSGFIPTNGEEKRIRDIVVVPPGSKLVYSIGGAGGGLSAAARVAATLLFYTRAI